MATEIQSIDLQTIIQGGAVGIAVLLILYMYLKDRMYNKTMNNHLSHLNETLGRLDGTMQASVTNQENVKNVIDRNSRVIEKNMNMIERLKGFLSGK